MVSLKDKITRREFLSVLLAGGIIALAGGYGLGSTVFKAVETVTRTITKTETYTERKTVTKTETQTYTETKTVTETTTYTETETVTQTETITETYTQTITQTKTVTERIKEIPECNGYASIVTNYETKILVSEGGKIKEVDALWAWDNLRKQSILISPKNLDDVVSIVNYAINYARQNNHVVDEKNIGNICAATNGRICPVTVLDPAYIAIGDQNGKAVQVYRGEAKLTIVPLLEENKLYVIKAKYGNNEFNGKKEYLEFVRTLPEEYRGYALRALEQLLDRKLCST